MRSRILPTLRTEREVAARLAGALDWSFVDLESYQISCGVIRRIPRELACRLRTVPIVWTDSHVVLVVDDPYTAAYIEANQELLGPPYRFCLEFAISTRTGIDAALRRRVTLAKD